MASPTLIPTGADPFDKGAANEASLDTFEGRFKEAQKQPNWDNIDYATILDPHHSMSDEARQNLNDYLERLEAWSKRDSNFIGNADAVDKNMRERVELMRGLTNESVLDHEKLKKFKPYIIADRAALAKPDLAEEAYERFQERRETLRERLGLETLRISAKEYQKLTTNIQLVMHREEFVEMHRDFINIRKEVAQENATHPRFVAEVATGPGKLFDELLVDLNHAELHDAKNTGWNEDSKIRARLFSQQVGQRDVLSEGNANTSTRIQSFTKMIAMGKQIIHDPLAIKEFAEEQKEAVGKARKAEYDAGIREESPAILKAKAEGWNQVGGKNYEIGMAALENKKFSPEMAYAFFESIDQGHALDPAERRSIFGSNITGFRQSAHAKDPVTMFRAAHAAFNRQYQEGDARAGMSYAVMDYSARQIMNDQEAIKRIAEIDLDAAQAIEQFRPENKDRIEQQVGGAAFEASVFEEMKKKPGVVAQETTTDISGKQITTQGVVDLEEVLKPNAATLYATVGKDGNIVFAASQEAYDKNDRLFIRNPLTREDGMPLDLMPSRQEGEKEIKPQVGESVPLYVEFQYNEKDPTAAPKVMVAASKDAMEMGDFAVFDDSFSTKPIPEKAGNALAPRAGTGEKETGNADSIRSMLSREGPYIHVATGGEVHISATEDDFYAGKKAAFSLYGVKVPPPGKDHATKDDAFDGGVEAKNHLEDLFTRYGKRGMKLTTVDGRDGQKEVMMRLPTGEDVSYRMLRDGYALPSECETMRGRREEAAQLADRNNRGLWANGFPTDDGSWRSESLMPHLTRRDKRENLKKTVAWR